MKEQLFAGTPRTDAVINEVSSWKKFHVNDQVMRLIDHTQQLERENIRMKACLLALRNHSSVSMHQIESIDEALTSSGKS